MLLGPETTKMRRAARIDQNHGSIVEALRASGWLVLSLARQGDGCPDILAHKPATQAWRLVEAKAGRGTLRASQVSFQAQGWPVTVIRTINEALALR